MREGMRRTAGRGAQTRRKRGSCTTGASSSSSALSGKGNGDTPIAFSYSAALALPLRESARVRQHFLDRAASSPAWPHWADAMRAQDIHEQVRSKALYTLRSAIAEENYSVAAELRDALQFARSTDTAERLLSQLGDAVRNEDFERASYLRDSGLSLVGWWLVSADSPEQDYLNADEPGAASRLMLIIPENGRLVGYLYDPQALSQLSCLKDPLATAASAQYEFEYVYEDDGEPESSTSSVDEEEEPLSWSQREDARGDNTGSAGDMPVDMSSVEEWSISDLEKPIALSYGQPLLEFFVGHLKHPLGFQENIRVQPALTVRLGKVKAESALDGSSGFGPAFAQRSTSAGGASGMSADVGSGSTGAGFDGSNTTWRTASIRIGSGDKDVIVIGQSDAHSDAPDNGSSGEMYTFRGSSISGMDMSSFKSNMVGSDGNEGGQQDSDSNDLLNAIRAMQQRQNADSESEGAERSAGSAKSDGSAPRANGEESSSESGEKKYVNVDSLDNDESTHVQVIEAAEVVGVRVPAQLTQGGLHSFRLELEPNSEQHQVFPGGEAASDDALAELAPLAAEHPETAESFANAHDLKDLSPGARVVSVMQDEEERMAIEIPAEEESMREDGPQSDERLSQQVIELQAQSTASECDGASDADDYNASTDGARQGTQSEAASAEYQEAQMGTSGSAVPGAGEALMAQHSLSPRMHFKRVDELCNNSIDPFHNKLHIGNFGAHGLEAVRFLRGWWGADRTGDENHVTVYKVIGDTNVPSEVPCFRFSASPEDKLDAEEYSQFGVNTRYRAEGLVAEEGHKNPRWVEGELFMMEHIADFSLGLLYRPQGRGGGDILIALSETKLPSPEELVQHTSRSNEVVQ